MFSLKKSDTYWHEYLRSKQRTRQIIKNSCIYGWVTFCECLEEMLISDEGCKHLSYFPISYLTKLFLCRVFDKIDSNKISNGGCWHLSRGQWPQLQNINLSINNLIQISIWLAIKAANTWLKATGETLVCFFWVQIILSASQQSDQSKRLLLPIQGWLAFNEQTGTGRESAK